MKFVTIRNRLQIGVVFQKRRIYIAEAMKYAFIPVAFLLSVVLVLTTVFAAVIKDRPTAFSNGSDIVLRWTTENEAGVQRFEILRRSGTIGDFLVVGTVEQLKGNNSSYEYVDRSVFKVVGGVYQYKIRVIDGSNPAPETEIVTVSHLSSTAKRTWGSIKAMFR